MATSFQFNNQTITEPGAYMQIKSAIKNPPQPLIYGNILLIDTGIGAGWGGGSGFDGVLENGRKSLLYFQDINDFRDKMMGGQLWDIAKPLFFPKGYQRGVKQITYMKAATTTPASDTINFGLGSITVKPRNEGLCGNGVLYNVSAKAIFTITHAGANNDEVTLQSNEGGIYPVTLGSYTCSGAVTSADIATGLKIAINLLTGTHGYTALVSGTSIEVTAPTLTGSAGNYYVPQYVLSGNSPVSITVVTQSYFTGGITGGLQNGYARQMIASPNTSMSSPSIFRLQYEVGTYKGSDAQGIPYDNIQAVNCPAKILVTSPDFTNIPDLLIWMKNDKTFNTNFVNTGSTYQGGGTVVAGDLVTNASLALFSGGTEDYTTAGIMDAVLDAVTNEYYNYVFCLEYGTNSITGAIGTNNTKIWIHIKTVAKYQKAMVVAGGQDGNEFISSGGSIDISKYFNDEKVACVHAGLGFISPNTQITKIKTSLYKAATYLGLKCGLTPENPATFKSIDMNIDMHDMTAKEQELATKYGVLTTINDNDYSYPFTIKLDISTLQNNDFQINEDATTYGNNMVAIKNMVANTICIHAKSKLLSDLSNMKSNTKASLSPSDVRNFVISELKAMEGGLITGYDDSTITVTSNQDAYFINLGFYPNSDISKLFFTAFLLDPNISI